MDDKRVIALRHTQHFRLQELTDSSLHPLYGLITLQCHDNIRVFSLPEQCLLDSRIDVSAGSHTWNIGDDNVSTKIPKLAISSLAGNLSIYAYSNHQFRSVSEFHRLTLKSLIADRIEIKSELKAADCCVLNFASEFLTVILDKTFIVKLKVEESRPWEVVYAISCPQKLVKCVVTGELISVIETDHSILLYDLNNGTLLAVIKRDREQNWTSCRVGKNYLNMVLQNEDGELYFCNLDQYFQENPLLLNKVAGSSSKPSASHWYEKVNFSGATHPLTVNKRTNSKKALYKLPFSGETLSYQITDDYVTAVLLWKNSMTLFCYNIITDALDKHELESQDYVILSPWPTIPHIILSNDEIKVPLIGHFSKQLSRVNPGDFFRVLSSSNNWGVTSVIPVNKLKAALESQELNDVADFFKSRILFLENLMSSPPVGSREELEQIFLLLQTSVTANVSNPGAQTFISQALGIAVEFFKEQTKKGVTLLQDMLINENTGKKDLLESILEKLSDFKLSLEKLHSRYTKPVGTRVLRKEPSRTSIVSVSKQSPELTKDLIKKWSSLNDKEIIGDGILMGNLSLLQAYFGLQGWEANVSWDHIISNGLDCVLDELEFRNWSTACQMLKNMGFGVFTKLTQIVMHLTDSQLRNYLLTELKSERQTPGVSEELFSFADLLHSLYPSECFQQAISLAKQDSNDRSHTSDSFKVAQYCGEISTNAAVTADSRWYCHYMLNWLYLWLPLRDEIVIDRVLHDKDLRQYLDSISAETIWSYLSRHNMLEDMIQWIEVQYNSRSPALAYEKHHITRAMLDRSCLILPSSSRIIIENKLALHGLLTSEVLGSLESRFMTLVKCNTIHNRGKAETVISFQDLINHCIKNSLYELLFSYFSVWGVDETNVEEVGSSLPTKDFLLLRLLYSFYKLSAGVADYKLLTEASLWSFRYLNRNSSLTWAEMFDKQITDAVLCCLAYHSPFLEGSNLAVSEDSLKLLEDHPILRHLTPNDKSALEIEEISIYTLLQKWGKINTDKLFYWQVKKTINPALNDAAVAMEMPHFANAALVLKMGQEEKLTFIHYLKQGRPSFAFVVFLADELSMSCSSTIPVSRMRLAISQTLYLAVKYYETLHICAACVAFIEMLNEPTKELRLLINTAHMLHKGKECQEKGLPSEAIHGYVESMILPLVFSKTHSVKLVCDALVESTDLYIRSLPLSDTSLAAGLKYKVAVEFSKHYNLPAPTRFLELCAKKCAWLSLLVTAQIFGYTHCQLTNVVNNFTDENIKEHLQCVLETCSSESKVDTVTPALTAQDKRAQLYARMGLVRKTSAHASIISSSEDETKKTNKEALQQMREDCGSLAPNEPQFVSVEHLPNDIFAVLFITSNHKYSYRQLNTYSILLENPILAVIAACDKGSKPLECFCSWLLSYLPGGSDLGKTLLEVQTGRFLTRMALLDIIKFAADKNKHLLIRTGLKIFLPTNQLIYLIDMIEEIQREDFVAAERQLSTFKTRITKVLKDRVCTDADYEQLTAQELTTLALFLLQRALKYLDGYLCERMLHILDNSNLVVIFSDCNVNFNMAHLVIHAAYEHRIADVDKMKLLSSNCLDEAKRVITALEDKQEYNTARKLCRACGLDAALVTLKQLETETALAINQKSWKKEKSHKDFWAHCHDLSVQYELDPSSASSFFESQVYTSTSLNDKIILSEYALSWKRQDPSYLSSQGLPKLLKLVWECKINAKIVLQEAEDYDGDRVDLDSYGKRPPVSLSVDKTQFLYTEYSYLDFLNMEFFKGQTTSVQNAVSDLIGELLDNLHFDEACQLAAEYKFYTSDLVIMLVCIGLALGTIDPNTVDVSQFTNTSTTRKRQTQSVYHGFSSTSLEDFSAKSKAHSGFDNNPCLQLIDKLSNCIRHGLQGCNKIKSCYKISLALSLSYKETILQSEYSLLKLLLYSNVSSKYILAEEYITTSCLSDSDVASFLASNVAQTLKIKVGLSSDYDFESDEPSLSESVSKAGNEFRQLITLFADPTKFGYSLLEEASNIAAVGPDAELQLAVKVELLIIAHESHSSAYDMEGISIVLRECRRCALQITELSYMSLLVHLLKGIGRYNDMTYIFETLKQNQQLELLFKGDTEKDDRLRLALLDYLRRFCLGDYESYKVVSSYFGMSRDIAQLLEETARKKLSSINFPAAKGQDNISQVLTDIQKNLTDAVEFYIEGQCLRHAQDCVKQARLVYLQIQLLSSGIQVINLDAQQVKSFIENHDRFYEVFAVSEAYNKSLWPIALCNNFLIKGDNKYFLEFEKCLPVTTSLATDVIQRFLLRSDAPRLPHTQVSLKKLLSFCKDVKVKYKLAKDLELSDVCNDLMAADGGIIGAVIKDTFLLAGRT